MLRPFLFPLLVIACCVMFLIEQGQYFEAFCTGAMSFSVVLMVAIAVTYHPKK